jgi:acetyl esterase/lipase
MRWLHANADRFGINSNFITSTGGSAGSQLAIVLGVTDPADFRDEVSTEADPTLLSTHLETRADVHTIVEHWGGTTAMGILEAIDGQNRFDETDPPMSIVHGTADETVFFTEAEQLRDEYIRTGVAHAYHPLEGKGHGAWNSRILVDGIETRLEPLAFEFVRQQQGLDLAP